MENLLLKYMNERFSQAEKKNVEQGPVITISRECGCPGRLLATKLTEQINKELNDQAKNWKWLNKEILSLASEELKINPEQISDLLSSEEKNFLDEIAYSFTVKYYATNARIRRVIRDVVRHIAVSGNVVIVGRGSEALTQDIQRSLHVKFYAPLSWKAEVVAGRNNISLEEAKEYVLREDKQRAKFVEGYLVKDQNKEIYDIEFNCAKFNTEEIIEVILKVAQIKSLL